MGIYDQRRRWIDCIGLSAGSYRIGWIVSYWMDRIGWILLVLVLGLLVETGFYAMAGLLLAGWDGCTGWDIGETGVVWSDRR